MCVFLINGSASTIVKESREEDIRNRVIAGRRNLEVEVITVFERAKGGIGERGIARGIWGKGELVNSWNGGGKRGRDAGREGSRR